MKKRNRSFGIGRTSDNANGNSRYDGSSRFFFVVTGWWIGRFQGGNTTPQPKKKGSRL